MCFPFNRFPFPPLQHLIDGRSHALSALNRLPPESGSCVLVLHVSNHDDFLAWYRLTRLLYLLARIPKKLPNGLYAAPEWYNPDGPQDSNGNSLLRTIGPNEACSNADKAKDECDPQNEVVESLVVVRLRKHLRIQSKTMREKDLRRSKRRHVLISSTGETRIE